MKRLFSLLALILFTGGLAACETLKGAGQDIENAGEEIDEEI
jgi:predicted small secreted protein